MTIKDVAAASVDMCLEEVGRAAAPNLLKATRAQSGTLSRTVGGQGEAAFTLVRPVPEAVGARIFRTE